MRRALAVLIVMFAAVHAMGCNGPTLTSGHYELRWYVFEDNRARLVPAALTVGGEDVILTSRDWYGNSIELKGTMRPGRLRLEAGSMERLGARLLMKGQVLTEESAEGDFTMQVHDEKGKGRWSLTRSGPGPMSATPAMPRR